MQDRHLPIIVLAFVVSAITTSELLAAELRDEIRAVNDDLAKQISQARAEYEAEVTKEAQAAVKSYERLATRAVRVGDLAAATTAWREALRLDRSNKGARDYFGALKLLDRELEDIEKESGEKGLAELAASSPNDAIRRLEGTTWSYEGGRTIEFQKGNVCTISNGREGRDTRMWSVDSLGNCFVSSNDGKFIVALRFRGDTYSAASFSKAITFAGKKFD